MSVLASSHRPAREKTGNPRKTAPTIQRVLAAHSEHPWCPGWQHLGHGHGPGGGLVGLLDWRECWRDILVATWVTRQEVDFGKSRTIGYRCITFQRLQIPNPFSNSVKHDKLSSPVVAPTEAWARAWPGEPDHLRDSMVWGDGCLWKWVVYFNIPIYTIYTHKWPFNGDKIWFISGFSGTLLSAITGWNCSCYVLTCPPRISVAGSSAVFGNCCKVTLMINYTVDLGGTIFLDKPILWWMGRRCDNCPYHVSSANPDFGDAD